MCNSKGGFHHGPQIERECSACSILLFQRSQLFPREITWFPSIHTLKCQIFEYLHLSFLLPKENSPWFFSKCNRIAPNQPNSCSSSFVLKGMGFFVRLCKITKSAAASKNMKCYSLFWSGTIQSTRARLSSLSCMFDYNSIVEHSASVQTAGGGVTYFWMLPCLSLKKIHICKYKARICGMQLA